MRRLLLPFGYGLAVLVLGACSGGEVPDPGPPPIDLPAGLLEEGDTRDLILVAVDTLRADRMPEYGGDRPTTGDPGTPFSIAWLAAQGTLFETVWAPAGRTMPSFSSLWTGLEPPEHGALSNRHRVLAPTFAMQLEGNGWRGHAAVSNFILRKGTGLQRGFVDTGMFRKEKEPLGPADLLRRTAEDVVEGRRMFVWGHYMAPHQPYEPRPPHQGRWSKASGVPGNKPVLQGLHRDPATLVPEVKAQLHSLYDEEILTANDYVKELLQGLDRQYRDAGRGGLLDNAVVVFLSDHGEELGGHEGYFMHAKSLYTGVIQVPLIVLGKGWDAGRREVRPLALAEVLPMVLSAQQPDREVFVATYDLKFYSIRDERWTLVHNPEDDRRGPAEPPEDAVFSYPVVALYDRHADPEERHDVAAAHPEVTRRLLDALNDWYHDLRPPYGTDDTPLDDQERNTIAEVGYATDEEEVEAPWIPWRGSRWNP